MSRSRSTPSSTSASSTRSERSSRSRTFWPRPASWRIKVTNVEIKHVDLNENMIRAIAKQAEAERLRRAKVINAEGEQQAAEKLVEAGRLLAREPQAMQLRYFAALHDIASERSSTIVFPLPTDLLTHLAPRPDGAK